MAPRMESRGQVTYKHPDIGPEFTSAVRMAAAQEGQAIGEFVVATLRARAAMVLKAGNGPGSAYRRPLHLEDIAELLLQQMAEGLAAIRQDQIKAMNRLISDHADALARLKPPAQRRG